VLATVTLSRASKLGDAPAGTAENPLRIAKEINPLTASSKEDPKKAHTAAAPSRPCKKVNRQNASRRLAAKREKPSSKVEVHPELLELLKVSLQHGREHNHGVSVSVAASGSAIKMTISSFAASPSQGQARFHHVASPFSHSSQFGRASGNPWRTGFTGNGGPSPHRVEEPSRLGGLQAIVEETSQHGGLPSPPRPPPPNLTSAQVTAAEPEVPQPVMGTPAQVNQIVRSLGVDASVAADALTDCGGNIKKAEDSIRSSIEAARMREKASEGNDSQASQSAKIMDEGKSSVELTPHVVSVGVPLTTAPVRVDGSKPTRGKSGSTSNAGGPGGSATGVPVSMPSNKTASGKSKGKVQMKEPDREGGCGKGGAGADGSGGSGSKDCLSAG